MKFTTYVGVDREHYPELLLSAATWRKFRPEIWQNKLVVIADGRFDFSFLAHPDLDVIDPIYGPFTSQREKMLTSLALEPGWCRTEWFLKLDTDTVAVDRCGWFDPGWFQSEIAIVASPWGYTKPASWLEELDRWAESKGMTGAPPVRSIRSLHGVQVAKSERFTSYAMWCRRDFAVVVGQLVGSKMPVPSQDTVYWYLAERLSVPYLRAAMSQFGWRHGGSSLATVESLCRRVVHSS